MNLPLNFKSYFYRSASGNELDLVIFPPGKINPIAIEVKYSLTPKLNKGFNIAMEDIKAAKGLFIYPGNKAYPLSENVTVVPFNQIFDLIGNLS
jgi:hypothetical protein